VDTSKTGLLDFLARTSNISGSVTAISTIGGSALLDFPAMVGIGLGVVGYAAGYLLCTPGKQTISVESTNDKVELASINRNIAGLRESIESHSSKLPEEIIQETEKIFEVLEEVMPKWDELKLFAEQKYTVNAIITEYLPQVITNYMNMPKSYYKNAAKKQVADEIVSQLKTLVTALEDIRNSLYQGVETDIKAQGAFLKSRFTSVNSLKL
jgi:hypothetical protein